MKKLLIAGIMLLTVTGFAQKFEKKIASSDKSIADEKKAINPKTWISRGELFYEIANDPVNGLVVGMDETTYKMVMVSTSEKSSETQETVNGTPYKVQVFPDKKVYFSGAGVLTFWEVFKYEVDDPFKKSYDAFQKARLLDPENKNKKKLAQNMKLLSVLARNEAFNHYQLGKSEKALPYFILSLDCSSDPSLNEIDSMIYYYTGVIAAEVGKNDIAEKYLRRAIEINYVEGGSVFAQLAEVLTKVDKKEEARQLLEKGMTENPENQQLLFGLINNYMASGRDAKEIIPLIKKAQEKEVTNASLYFAEGNLYEKIDDFDNAMKCYEKAIEIDPNYFFGYYGVGILYFNQGAKFDTQAMAEKDNKKYEELVSRADEQLKKALPFFEKAFTLNNPEAKKVVVQALKDINFRFRTESETYKADAEKYAKLLEEL